jgi:hypothetical protein
MRARVEHGALVMRRIRRSEHGLDLIVEPSSHGAPRG